MDLLDQLGLNGTLLAAIVQFVLLLWLLKAVAYKPILKALDDRKQFIENSLATAEANRAEAEKLRAEHAAQIQNAKKEAQEVIQMASKAAEDNARGILADAQEESNRLKKSALEEIELEKKKAIAELRDQVAILSVMAASKVINQNLDPKAQHQLIDEFLKEVGDLPC